VSVPSISLEVYEPPLESESESESELESEKPRQWLVLTARITGFSLPNDGCVCFRADHTTMKDGCIGGQSLSLTLTVTLTRVFTLSLSLTFMDLVGGNLCTPIDPSIQDQDQHQHQHQHQDPSKFRLIRYRIPSTSLAPGPHPLQAYLTSTAGRGKVVARSEIVTIWHRRLAWLEGFQGAELSVYSQNGEDGVLEEN